MLLSPVCRWLISIASIEHAITLVALHVAVPLQDHCVHGERARLVRAQHVHRSEVLNRVQALHDHVFPRHRHGPLGEAYRNDHREHLGRESDGDRQGKEEGFVPVVLGQSVDEKDDGHHHRHEPDHEPGESVDADVERRLRRGLGEFAGQRPEQGAGACLHHDRGRGAALHTGAEEAQIRTFERILIRSPLQDLGLFGGEGLPRERRLADEQILGRQQSHVCRYHVAGRQHDDVARDDFAQRDLTPHPVAQRRCCDPNHGPERGRRRAGAGLLHEPQGDPEDRSSGPSRSPRASLRSRGRARPGRRAR